MSAFKKYLKEVKKQFAYRATWLPGEVLQVGDIGIIKNAKFFRQTNLANMGIEFELKESDNPTDYEFMSEGDVKVTMKLAGKAPTVPGSVLGVADAGVTVQFNKKNAILFEVKQATQSKIDDIPSIGRQIEQLFEDGDWKKEYVVITELVKGKEGTVLISRSSNLVLDFKAKGEVGAGKVKVSDAGVELLTTVSKKQGVVVKNDTGITPLYSIMGIKKGWFDPDGDFQLKGLVPDGAKEQEIFTEDKLTDEEIEAAEE